jgi:hypothetical protein
MPTPRSTVSGSAPIVIAISTAVSSVSVYIDGVYLASGPPLIIDWNSKTVTDGQHKISVTGYGPNNAVVGASSVIVNVNNRPVNPLVSLSASSSNTTSVTSLLGQTVGKTANQGVFYKASL